MNPESFFHVAIKVEDVEESIAFYRRYFGAELLERSDGGGGDDGDDEGGASVEHAALSVADKRVYLFDRAPYEAAGLVDPLPTGFLHFGFVVDDVDAAHGELTAAGTEFVMEPSTFGDLRIAFLVDPAGVRVELLEHR